MTFWDILKKHWLMLCTAWNTFRIWHIQHSVFFIYMPAYSINFSIIEAYSHILRHYEGIFRLIQVYSAPCVAIAYFQPWHVLSPTIFRTRGLFKILWNVDKAYSEPCLRALFSHIQTYSELCRTLVYPETWHTQNPGIFRTLP